MNGTSVGGGGKQSGLFIVNVPKRAVQGQGVCDKFVSGGKGGRDTRGEVSDQKKARFKLVARASHLDWCPLLSRLETQTSVVPAPLEHPHW